MDYQGKAWSVESGLAKGRAAPSWYYERPESEAGDDFYIAAFWELSTERAFGMSLGPIPWSVIVEYGMVHGLDDDVLAVFVQVIRQMDGAYLEHHARVRKESVR